MSRLYWGAILFLIFTLATSNAPANSCKVHVTKNGKPASGIKVYGVLPASGHTGNLVTDESGIILLQPMVGRVNYIQPGEGFYVWVDRKQRGWCRDGGSISVNLN